MVRLRMAVTAVLKFPLKASFAPGLSKLIPAGERIEITGYFKDGQTRIYSPDSKQPLEGFMVSEAELRAVIR